MQWVLLGVGIVVGFAVAWWWLNRTWSARLAPLEQERDAALSRAADAESEVTVIGASLADAQSSLDKATADLEAAGTEHQRVSAALTDAEQKYGEAEKARKAAEVESARLSGDLASQAERVSAATGIAASTEAKYTKITEEFVELRRIARQVEIERDAAIRDRDAGVAEANARASQAEASVAGAQEEVADAHEERDRIGGELLRMRERSGDIHALRKEAQAAQREVSDLLDANAERERHIRRLEAELEASRRSAEPVSPPPEPEPDPAEELVVSGLPPAEPTRSPDEEDAPLSADPPETQVDEVAAARAKAEEPESREGPSEPADERSEGESVLVDDLQRIKGIGPKFEQMLHARGISTFSDVAAIDDDEALETYLETFAGRIEREDWRGQATALQAEKTHRPD